MGDIDRILALALSISLASGCSFIGSRVPESRPPDERLDCGPSLALAVTDTIPAVAGLSIAGYVASVGGSVKCRSGDNCGDEDLAALPRHALAIVSLFIAVAYAPSAAHGYSAYARCRSLNADAPLVTGADKRRAFVERWNRQRSTVQLSTGGRDASVLIVDSPGCDDRSVAALGAAYHWNEVGFKKQTCSFEMAP